MISKYKVSLLIGAIFFTLPETQQLASEIWCLKNEFPFWGKRPIFTGVKLAGFKVILHLPGITGFLQGSLLGGGFEGPSPAA